MLKDYPVLPTIPTADLAKARSFYEQTLGFGPGEEDPGGILYTSGSGQFYLYPSQFAGTGQQTVASWEVKDIEAEVTDLRGRGVTFEQYDMAELKTDEKGIAEVGGFRGAWFKDPDGNILSVGQRTA